MNITLLIFQLVVLICSVMIHEIAHGAVALALGDQTAKRAGRLTFNPLRHIDPFGSVILPILLSLLPGAPVLGWAKPVPYNPLNLKNPRRGAGIIGAAGPVSNLLVATVFGLAVRFLSPLAVTEPMLVLFGLLHIVVIVNVALALFNLIPLPPLDGANILFALLPPQFEAFERFLVRYGFYLFIILIVGGLDFLSPAIAFLYTLLVGGGIG